MRVYWTNTISNKKSAELNAWNEQQANIRAARKQAHLNPTTLKIIKR